jgi:hypothetical protein
MSSYYLKSIVSNTFIVNDEFNTLDEAIKKARELTKETPIGKIVIIKSIAIIEKHTEIFYN